MRPMGGRNRNLRRGCVIMAGKGRPIAPRLGHGCCLMQGVHPVAQGALTGDVLQNLGLGQALLAAVMVVHLGQVAKLPLARGVIHQDENSDAVTAAKFRHFRHQNFRATSARRCRKWLIRKGAGIFPIVCLAMCHTRSNPQRIKHSGNPRAGQRAVIRCNRSVMRPVHLRNPQPPVAQHSLD